MEKGMATHTCILAWRIPMDREAWWATVHRVTKSRTWLKQLSTHAHPQNKEEKRFEGCQVIAQDHSATVFYQIYDTAIILNTVKKEKNAAN